MLFCTWIGTTRILCEFRSYIVSHIGRFAVCVHVCRSLTEWKKWKWRTNENAEKSICILCGDGDGDNITTRACRRLWYRRIWLSSGAKYIYMYIYEHILLRRTSYSLLKWLSRCWWRRLARTQRRATRTLFFRRFSSSIFCSSRRRSSTISSSDKRPLAAMGDSNGQKKNGISTAQHTRGSLNRSWNWIYSQRIKRWH